MKHLVYATAAVSLLAGSALADSRGIQMEVNPEPALLGQTVRFVCEGTGEWEDGLRRARISIRNADDTVILDNESMDIDRRKASYDYTLSGSDATGMWDFTCSLEDREDHRLTRSSEFNVAANSGGGGSGGGFDRGGVTAHQYIQNYEGPQTCINCHQIDAQEMLGSLHMAWSGPTPEVTNLNGAEAGKAVNGINTFCTYAMSSRGACFSCHVRADGNAPHPPEITDVDCLMCHNDTYQRMFVPDTDSPVTVTNIDGETKTYVFGLQDENGDYTTVPDYDKMPAGTTMETLARNVHLPTRKSCLRCHAKAGGGDWTKRGDMGLNTVAPTVTEDVHMSADPGGADLTCTACHVTVDHKIGGRGIDLRQSEAPDPKCSNCHGEAPHEDNTLNRHARGQVSCQVCHIREFGKGGATEMSRDWLKPHWNPAFCAGQGGFVGEEIKEANVKPEYVWFDGTSTVYNIGETIEPDERGVYPMARANGDIFDGRSLIVPIKRHFTVMPLHESGKMVPPVIMEMFMTGDFDQAVQAGMAEQGMTGGYTMVEADAEMLITHGVEPASMAPGCGECHDFTGETPDGSGMVPFGELGYHTWPAEVRNCTLCHERKSMSWQTLHDRHVAGPTNDEDMALSCVSCHTGEPTGLVSPRRELCGSCHELKSWEGSGSHKKHVKKGYECANCHTF